MRRVAPVTVAVAGAIVVTAAVGLIGGIEQLGQVAAAGRQLIGLPLSILAAVVGLDLGAILLIGVLWMRLIRLFGHRVSFRIALRAALSSGLAGYLDNIVGSAVGAVVTLRRQGLSAPRAARLSLLAYLLQFCGVLVWAPLGVWLVATSAVGAAVPVVGRASTPAVIIMVGGMIVVMPVLILLLAGAPFGPGAVVRRIFGQGAALSGAPIRLLYLLALVPLAAMAWLGNALALFVLVGALHPAAQGQPVMLAGTAALASTLGALAFFVPEGFGVRDGLLLALLAQTLHLSLIQSAVAVLALRALDILIKVGLLVTTGVSGSLIRRVRDGAALGALWSCLRLRPSRQIPRAKGRP